MTSNIIDIRSAQAGFFNGESKPHDFQGRKRMVVSVTAVMMAATNNHEPAEARPMRWNQGEIVDVFPLDLTRTDNNHPRFYLLHITNYPGTFEEVSDELLELHTDPPDPTGTPHMRRRTVVDFNLLSPPDWTELTNTRAVQMTHGQFIANGARQRDPSERAIANQAAGDRVNGAAAQGKSGTG